MNRIPLTALSLLISVGASAQEFTVIDALQFQRGDLTHEIETVIVDGDEQQQFRAHRLSRQGGGALGAVILLHGGEAGFTFYLEHASGNLSENIAGFLARRGYDVYGHDPRGSFLTVEQCDQPDACAFAAEWGYEATLEDLEYIKSKVAQAHSTEPVIGGLSRGAMSAVAAVNAAPQDFSGAVVWEGMLFTEDPEVLALNALLCDQFTAALAAGIYADTQSAPLLKVVIQLSQAAPDEPSPLFPGLTNREVKFQLLTTPQGGLVPDFTQLAGRPQPPRLFFSREEDVDFSALLLNDVIPMDLQRDTACALAGLQDFGSNLGSFDRPVFFIEAGKGFGPFMGDQKALFSSADPTTRSISVFGHADTLSARSVRGIVFAPLLHWLNRNRR